MAAFSPHFEHGMNIVSCWFRGGNFSESAMPFEQSQASQASGLVEKIGYTTESRVDADPI
jgi:hypothetical protein